MYAQTISPASHRAETRGVVLAAVVIAALWAALVAWSQAAPPGPALQKHQRSAFAYLTSLEQGLFHDLRAAAGEIEALRLENNAWPEPSDLAAGELPPFADDAVARRRGGHRWQRLDFHQADHVAYWGIPDSTSAAEWVLAIRNGQPSVWRREPSVSGTLKPATSLDQLAEPSASLIHLIAIGWLEVVPQAPTKR